MSLFRRESKLEQLLRAQRPRSAELTHAISTRMNNATSPPARPTQRWRPVHLRLGLAATLTAALLVTLASVGGLGSAASAAKQAAKAIQQAVDSENVRAPQGAGDTINAGGDQYQPGYGWGDPNHTHTGPPGLEQRGKVQVRRQGDSTIVSFRLFLDEQADLFISVIAPNGRQLPLTANNLPVPQGTGTRLQYRVLVPRTLQLSLRLPSAKLEDGKRYTIRIVARDPDNKPAKLNITFRV